MAYPKKISDVQDKEVDLRLSWYLVDLLNEGARRWRRRRNDPAAPPVRTAPCTDGEAASKPRC